MNLFAWHRSRRPQRSRLKVSMFFHSLEGGSYANLGATLLTAFSGLGLEVEAIVSSAAAETSASALFPVYALQASGLWAVFRLASYLNRSRPDVLLSLGTSKNLTALAARFFARTQTKYVISEHTTMSDELHREHPGNRKMQILYPRLIRRLYPRSDGLISPARVVLDDPEFLGLFDSASKPRAVIANPLPSRPAAAAPTDLHPWLKQPHELPVVLGIGRLSEQKGFDTLIRAVSALVEQDKPVRLLILGEGAKRAQLEALVRELGLSDYVQMPGFVDNVPGYLEAADTFALSSRWEAFGLVLIEAMAAGTPIVSTQISGGPELLLEQGKSAVMVPVDDPQALAAGLDRVLTDKALAHTLARAGLDEGKKFTPEAIAAEYVAFFEQVLGSPASRAARSLTPSASTK